MKTIYLNGTIRTMAGNETAEALLEENGRILQTGRAADLLGACPAARRFDLQGHALLPGFIDGHSHITALAQTLLLCDLHGAKSFSEIAERLRAFCAARVRRMRKQTSHRRPPSGSASIPLAAAKNSSGA